MQQHVQYGEFKLSGPVAAPLSLSFDRLFARDVNKFYPREEYRCFGWLILGYMSTGLSSVS